MKRTFNRLRLIQSTDLDVDGGRALWEDGDDADTRYCFSYTIQPATGTVQLGDADSLLDANGPFGISILAGQVFSQGNQEVRGSDVEIDLSKIRVRGDSPLIVLLEVPDQ